MSLRTISNEESRGRRAQLNVQRVTNRTDDIERSNPFYAPSRYTNKPDLHGVGDIERSQPKSLHAGLRNKPAFSYTNDDIDGSKPKPYTFKTARVVDPVDPVYALPSSTKHEITPPRFLRDGRDVSDIRGTAPRPIHRGEQRDTMGAADIEGAQAGWKPRHKVKSDQPRNTLDVGDILHVGFKTSRVSDPLNPHHIINGTEIVDDNKTRPRPLPKCVRLGSGALGCCCWAFFGGGAARIVGSSSGFLDLTEYYHSPRISRPSLSAFMCAAVAVLWVYLSVCPSVCLSVCLCHQQSHWVQLLALVDGHRRGCAGVEAQERPRGRGAA